MSAGASLQDRAGQASPGALRSPPYGDHPSRNPYHVEGPALISFSGGRTSAFMLWHILDAFDGALPGDVHVVFANTGKEREETLRFVHECGSRWGVPIHWLEWRSRPLGKEGRETPPDCRHEAVGYNSASRNGEPFMALIAECGVSGTDARIRCGARKAA